MDQNFHHLFNKTAHLHFIKRQALLRENGIDFSPHVLRIILKNSGITQNELATQLCHAPASVTTLINRLEKSNYVVRKCDNEDMRKKRIYITDEGIVCLEKANEISSYSVDKYLYNFTEEELENFTYLLTKMYDNLTQKEV